MLEVKALSKIYKSKKGAPVNALDGVTLSFPEKGMVFLLGKSGSGKSTLLNVCGGLDSPTSGEIIVKGRSSKNFSQSDFDSYRNTFIGFIFQEYNILNEFTVEDNIALALELQNKPKDKAAVENLLEQVDLVGFAKRKPNTLSGGQKQRIAIARALIKNPEIIMADEPTGALDSATGKQVLETLKKLSLEKLVIVVSHDRDFAEQYGDRIIELKDGKVISDISKTQESEVSLTKNISSMGDILSIKQGANLDDNDFEQIKSFLKKTNNNIIITSGEKQVEEFKKANRITDDGEREVFKDTKPFDQKQYRPEDSKFIRSRLPLRHAIKIGLSGLKSKPVRLTFTVLLCTCAFIMFSLLSTMMLYNNEATFKETLQNINKDTVKVSKEYLIKMDWYYHGELSNSGESASEAKFTDAEINELKAIYGSEVFSGVKVSINYNIRTSGSRYYKNQIETLAFMDSSNSIYRTINGTYPVADNEILISSYMASVLLECQTYDESGNTVTLTSPSDAIGKKLIFNGSAYKITGIFESGEISAEFDVLKDSSGSDNYRFESAFYSELTDGMHLVAFVNQNEIKRYSKEYSNMNGYKMDYRRVAAVVSNGGGNELPEHGNVMYQSLSEVGSDKKLHFIEGNKTNVGDGEVLVGPRQFADVVSNFYHEKIMELEQMRDPENYDPSFDAKIQRYYEIVDTCSQISMGGKYNFDEATKKDNFVPFTDAELSDKIKIIVNAMKSDNINLKLDYRLYDTSIGSHQGDKKQLNVVGFYTQNTEQFGEDVMLVSDALNKALWDEQKQGLEFYEESSTKYVEDENAIYSVVFLPYDHSKVQTDTYWDIYENKEYKADDTRIKLSDSFVYTLEMVDSSIKELSKIFFYIGLVLAVFAALLFSNFISVSISQKKKDIGILRAVGAKGTDVFKIFFSESAFVAMICIVLSSIASALLCNVLNVSLAENLGASLLVFGIPSFLILVAIAILTAIISTFLPVNSAARKKPIDSIRSM